MPHELDAYDTIGLAIMVALGIYIDQHGKKKREKYPNALDIESEVVPIKLKELTA